MSTGLQLALLAGGLVGAGIALVVWHLVPAQPDLADALARLDPRAPTNQIAVTTDGDGHERLGRWAMRLLPPRVWGRVPTADLAVLRMSLSHFYGEKVLFLLVGVMILPAFTVLLSALGHPLPVAIPAAGSLVLGAVMFRLPNHNVTDEAKKAREEFRRALAAYYELVALERLGGAAHRQAMVDAATVADSWIFGRIREELARSAWAGIGPWDALQEMSTQYQVNELSDLAQAMKLSGSEGTEVAAALRARAGALRGALLNEDLARANTAGEKMTIPGSLTAVIFVLILLGPQLMRIAGAG